LGTDWERALFRRTPHSAEVCAGFSTRCERSTDVGWTLVLRRSDDNLIEQINEQLFRLRATTSAAGAASTGSAPERPSGQKSGSSSGVELRMTESPIRRLRERLNEFGVGEMPFRDYSPDRIGIRELRYGSVEFWDREGRSWIGSADAALAALADLHRIEDPLDVWMRLARARQ
jgi:hypothetical protein